MNLNFILEISGIASQVEVEEAGEIDAREADLSWRKTKRKRSNFPPPFFLLLKNCFADFEAVAKLSRVSLTRFLETLVRLDAHTDDLQENRAASRGEILIRFADRRQQHS